MIRILKKVWDMLKDIGKKSEYDGIIRRLIEKRKEGR